MAGNFCAVCGKWDVEISFPDMGAFACGSPTNHAEIVESFLHGKNGQRLSVKTVKRRLALYAKFRTTLVG